MRSLFRLLCAALLLMARPAHAQTHPLGFDDVLVAGGLTQPTALVMTPSAKLLVGQRGGVIRVIDHGVLLPKPMLTLNVETFDEQGLLGLALHPSYPSSPYLFVFYTPFTGQQTGNFNRVARFTIQADTVVAGSELLILGDIPSGLGFHIGGCLRTTADNRLWVSIGENGLGTLAPRQPSRLEGKLLRLNLDGSAPGDNPFYGVPGRRWEIYQMGLRNPFRFQVQPGTLQPFVNDVGSTQWEEVNRGPAGTDFGFPTYEGVVTSPPAGVVNPIYTYRTNGNGSITGSAFYTGTQFPAAYVGNYFFLDHSRGQIGRIVLDGANNVVATTFPWGTTAGFGWGNGPVDLMMGIEGALYYTQYAGNQVRKITYGPQVGVGPQTPSPLSLQRPSPDPSEGPVALRFSLPASGRVQLRVFDVEGRIVRTIVQESRDANTYTELWDGTDASGVTVPPGVYLARVEAGGAVRSQRLVRLR